MVTLFFSQLREDIDMASYDVDRARMMSQITQLPGFVSSKIFTAEDGERLNVVMFESSEAQDQWRFNPGHNQTQQKGREGYYQYYRSIVCESVRESNWEKE